MHDEADDTGARSGRHGASHAMPAAMTRDTAVAPVDDARLEAAAARQTALWRAEIGLYALLRDSAADAAREDVRRGLSALLVDVATMREPSRCPR